MAYFLEKEIHEQPGVIQNLLNEQWQVAQAIARAIQEHNPSYVMIAARGTSDNAARYAQYVLGIQADLPVGLATPSVHTLYESPPRFSNAVVIGISQSGQSSDVHQVLVDANAQGALTIGITNNPESAIAQTSDYHIFLSCGEEISVAATKTYTTQLTAIAMIAVALVGDAEQEQLLQRLPQWASETLELSAPIPQWTERYRYIDHIASIGRGYNYCTAFEISLKLKELCYITGEEYSEADFRHGPIAMISRGFPVLIIAPKGKPLPLLLDLLGKLQEKQAECLVISNDKIAHEQAYKAMSLPNDIPEWLSPIVAVIPGQIFAMNLAIAKGNPVDRPEGLNKVTITR